LFDTAISSPLLPSNDAVKQQDILQSNSDISSRFRDSKRSRSVFESDQYKHARQIEMGTAQAQKISIPPQQKTRLCHC
jgi:hypothetical protein